MNNPPVPNAPIVGGEPHKYKAPKTIWDAFNNMFLFLNDRVLAINNSKIFAGIIIIVMNIASKFVVFKLSKSMEAYLKYTFSRNILVFAMAWMGTRDIYVAFFMTILFIICTTYLFNEESPLCCLPEQFTEYHISLSDENEIVSEEQVKQAKEVLERAEKQKSRHKTDTTDEGFDEKSGTVANSKLQQPPLPPHLTKIDTRIDRSLILDDEPYHPWA